MSETPFLLILLEKHGVSEQRIAAREKLSRLLQNQLQDLSTDVYDELKRRTDGAQGMCPFFRLSLPHHNRKLTTTDTHTKQDLKNNHIGPMSGSREKNEVEEQWNYACIKVLRAGSRM